MARESETLFCTIPEACRRLGIGRTMIYQLVSDGRLRPVKLGRRTLIPTAELRRFAAELMEQAS